MKRAPLRRKTRLKPVSKKRAAVNRRRSRLVRRELLARRICEAGPVIYAHRAAGYGREHADRLNAKMQPFRLLASGHG